MDKLGQALLQTGQLLVIRASAIAKLGRKFVTNWATTIWGKSTNKVGQLNIKWDNFYYKMEQLYYKVGQVLQQGAIITKLGGTP